MYTITAYPTNAYNLHETIHKQFSNTKKLWNWCREYLSQPNRKVVVHRLNKRYKWGESRDRKPEYVTKIGIFTSSNQIPVK